MQALIQTPDTPLWLALAATQLGVSEIKGKAHRAEVLRYWRDIKRGGIKDDETAWCAAFVGAMLERAGVQSSRYESVSSYSLWGKRLKLPVQGAIALLDHHVAFVAGIRSDNRIMLLGGNQNDAVTISPFHSRAIIQYRYPANMTVSTENLPVYKIPALADAGAVKIV